MEQHRRISPLIENPDSIGDKMEVSAETFLNFLHQNYPAFFGSMDDLKSAAEYLSDGDFILSGWKFDDSGCKQYKVVFKVVSPNLTLFLSFVCLTVQNQNFNQARQVKEQVAMSTTIRGLMHSNNNRVSVGWKPLTKPLVSNLEKTTRDR